MCQSEPGDCRCLLGWTGRTPPPGSKKKPVHERPHPPLHGLGSGLRRVGRCGRPSALERPEADVVRAVRVAPQRRHLCARLPAHRRSRCYFLQYILLFYFIIFYKNFEIIIQLLHNFSCLGLVRKKIFVVQMRECATRF